MVDKPRQISSSAPADGLGRGLMKISTLSILEQELASVTVTTKIESATGLTELAAVIEPEFQEYVVPPVAFKVRV